MTKQGTSGWQVRDKNLWLLLRFCLVRGATKLCGWCPDGFRWMWTSPTQSGISLSFQALLLPLLAKDLCSNHSALITFGNYCDLKPGAGISQGDVESQRSYLVGMGAKEKTQLLVALPLKAERGGGNNLAAPFFPPPGSCQVPPIGWASGNHRSLGNAACGAQPLPQRAEWGKREGWTLGQAGPGPAFLSHLCTHFLWLPQHITAKLVALNNRNVFFYHSGGQKFKIKCQQGYTPLRGSKRESFPASSNFSWFQGFLGCGCILPVSAFLFTWPPLLSVCDTCHWMWDPLRSSWMTSAGNS